MTFQCIMCDKTWDDGLRTEDISHGICKACGRERMKDLIRMKQVREGNFPCFATASTYCNQFNCKYRSVCLKNKEEML